MPDPNDGDETDEAQEASDENAPPPLGGPRVLGHAGRLPGLRGPPGGKDVAVVELLVADGVVNEAAEGHGVAEGLEGGDLGLPDDDGDDDEEDGFQDAGEGHDETRSLANLDIQLVMMFSSEDERGVLTKQTLAILSMNATSALRMSMKGPASHRCCISNLGASLPRATNRFRIAQTGA